MTDQNDWMNKLKQGAQDASRAAKQQAEAARDWVLQDAHKERAQALSEDVRRAFTEHPAEVEETYGQHWLFTVTMGGRLIYVALVLIIHGIFPFLFVRTASNEIEHVYRAMKARIPQARRDAMDASEQ